MRANTYGSWSILILGDMGVGAHHTQGTTDGHQGNADVEIQRSAPATILEFVVAYKKGPFENKAWGRQGAELGAEEGYHWVISRSNMCGRPVPSVTRDNNSQITYPETTMCTGKSIVAGDCRSCHAAQSELRITSLSPAHDNSSSELERTQKKTTSVMSYFNASHNQRGFRPN